MTNIIIFCLGLGFILGFALASVLWIVYYTNSNRRKSTYYNYPNWWEKICIGGAILLSYIVNDYVTDILTSALKNNLKDYREYEPVLYWFIFAMNWGITLFCIFIAYFIESKAINRFVFKSFILAIVNAFLLVLCTAILCYQIAIDLNNSDLMNYGSLFLASGSLIGTLFIAAIQLKDIVEK